MRPHLDHLGRRSHRTDDVQPHPSRDLNNTLSRSLNSPRRLRSEDSWVEVSSQPSSSSLSSTGDEAATPAYIARSDHAVPRRRRRHQLNHLTMGETRSSGRPRSATGSSQDEYEESESGSDQVMNSSNEDVLAKDQVSLLPSKPSVEEDDDDASTALGTRTSETVFTPQPHAFSHPPNQFLQPSRELQVDSYFQPDSRLPSNRTITPRDLRRPSMNRSRTQTQHTPYNVIAPSHSYQTDHDAALRASLSTLLSCAAAARGLSKRSQSSHALNQQSQAHVIEPTSLRLIPESRLKSGDTSPPMQAPMLPVRKSHAPTSSSLASPMVSTSSPLPSSNSPTPSAKRKARESSKDRLSRATKKSRSATRSFTGEDTTVSPTLMTWMISAGFVVLFSAASFAAGYAWGREVGRMEAGLTPIRDGMQSGRGLLSRGTSQRLRWGGGGGGSSSVRVGA